MRTGDLSRNNWWVGILAWGEGWHNNHHAFEFSARHGLEVSLRRSRLGEGPNRGLAAGRNAKPLP